MHEAKWNREKDDADNRRSRTSILRAAISNASNERERHFSSMLWRQSRLERFRSSILHFRGGSKGTSWAFRRSGADSNGTCRAFCGSRAGSSGHYEPTAALGQSWTAFSSQLRLRANLARPFRTSCGFRPGSSGHFEPAAAPGQARPAFSSQLRLRARLEVGNLGRCDVFEARQATKPRKPQERVQNPKPPNAETNFKNKYMFAPPLSTLGSTFVNFIRFYKCSNFWKLIENLHDNLQKHFPFIFNKDSRNKCQGIGPGRSRNSFHGFFKRVSKNNVRGFQGAPKVFSNSFSSAFSWFIKVW